MELNQFFGLSSIILFPIAFIGIFFLWIWRVIRYKKKFGSLKLMASSHYYFAEVLINKSYTKDKKIVPVNKNQAERKILLHAGVIPDMMSIFTILIYWASFGIFYETPIVLFVISILAYTLFIALHVRALHLLK